MVLNTLRDAAVRKAERVYPLHRGHAAPTSNYDIHDARASEGVRRTRSLKTNTSHRALRPSSQAIFTEARRCARRSAASAARSHPPPPPPRRPAPRHTGSPPAQQEPHALASMASVLRAGLYRCRGVPRPSYHAVREQAWPITPPVGAAGRDPRPQGATVSSRSPRPCPGWRALDRGRPVSLKRYYSQNRLVAFYPWPGAPPGSQPAGLARGETHVGLDTMWRRPAVIARVETAPNPPPPRADDGAQFGLDRRLGRLPGQP